MFKTVINSTPLVNEQANSFFENIYGDNFRGDVTFVSTLRALVAPRIKEDEYVVLRFGQTNFTSAEVGRTPTTEMVRKICDFFYNEDRGNIYIHNFNSNIQEDNFACIELMKSTFTKVYSGWHRLEKVTDFYRKQFGVMCFINPEIKSVAIFAENMDIRKMHYLQCSIFAFLPWYFNPDEGVSELEYQLIDSLREKTSTKYEEALAKIASQYDFRTQRIKQLLAGFETKYERIECQKVEREIMNVIDTINSLNSQIGEYLSAKNDMETKLLGLETKIANGDNDSEIMDYFLCNDKLVLLNVTDTKMRFAVKTYLEYFDEDMARSVIGNKSSYVYAPNGRRCNSYIPEASMEKLMNAIFIDQILKIRFCAAYEFDLNGGVRAIQGYNFGHEFFDYTPNTHINQYRCLGTYDRAINNLLAKRDYIGAIEQCTASCKSLNFGDSTVMKTFISTVYGLPDYSHINNRCIELPDGRIVKPLDAVKWLEESESNE